jgi:hypothetical protein
MPSSGMLLRVALVRTDVSEDISASIIRVTRIGELGTRCHAVQPIPAEQTIIGKEIQSVKTRLLRNQG